MLECFINIGVYIQFIITVYLCFVSIVFTKKVIVKCYSYNKQKVTITIVKVNNLS